jgi:DNA polymerase III alpha subunit (gram-positive type)
MLEFTAIDFETVPSQHGPIAAEIGLVVFNEKGQISHHFEASAPVNKLYANSANCRDSIISTWPEIKTHLQGKIILGHNIGYDYAILKKCFPALAIDRTVDSLYISRQVYKKIFSDYSLTSLLDCLDLTDQLESLQVNDHFTPHRALYDAMGCALLTLALLTKPLGRDLIIPPQQSLF